jgi:hypothetical protein
MTFWDNYLQRLQAVEDVRVQPQLNDNGDVIFRLRPEKTFLQRKAPHLGNEELLEMFDEESGREEDEEEHKREPLRHCSIFFFTPGPKKEADRNHVPFMYFDSPTDDIVNLRGISMNSRYLFLWNDGYAWKIDLETHEKSRMSLAISLNEKMTKIVRVRTGSSPKFVCIRVK